MLIITHADLMQLQVQHSLAKGMWRLKAMQPDIR